MARVDEVIYAHDLQWAALRRFRLDAKPVSGCGVSSILTHADAPQKIVLARGKMDSFSIAGGTEWILQPLHEDDSTLT